MSASSLFKFRHEAMATVFEVIISQDDGDEAYAGQAARAVFAEVDRLEDELSRFRAVSDIWRVNHLQAGERAPVGLAALDCLLLAQTVQAETAGAFDITIGPLMHIFRNDDGTPRTPQPDELALVKSHVGPQVFTVDESGFVTAHVDYPLLDLGAVGKGYALDQAANILQEWSVHNAVLNAGDSSILAIGAPLGERGWIVTVGNKEKIPLTLVDRAISASGFMVKGGHIMNPRTMQPLPVKPERVWASAPTAALSDALSTAFAVMSPAEVEAFCARHPDVEAITA